MGEEERVALLSRVLAQPAAGVRVGIGDDAAVLELEGRRLVFTIDEQVEGVHFRRELVSLRDLGWRATMSAASDVAAMGADPWCALAAVALPASVADSDLEELASGQAEAARALGAPVVGGNMSRGERLSVATTFLGTLPAGAEAIPRAGARAGDGVWLAGPVGLAAAGLAALERGADAPAAVAAWRRLVARVRAGRAMRGLARAAIDVSDGLSRDAARVASASGVAIELDADAVLAACPGLAEAARAAGRDALELALSGGEDYALLCASPSPVEGFVRVGEVREGRGLLLRRAGRVEPLAPRGWDHFGG